MVPNKVHLLLHAGGEFTSIEKSEPSTQFRDRQDKPVRLKGNSSPGKRENRFESVRLRGDVHANALLRQQ